MEEQRYRIGICKTIYSDFHFDLESIIFDSANILLMINRLSNVQEFEGAEIILKEYYKEEELFMCAPTLYGFSFAAKKWGQIYVDQLEGII